MSNVNSTTIIGIAKYNEIQSTIADLLSTYYGASVASSPIIGSGGIIYSASQWYPLYKDVNRCITHQTSAVIPSAVVPSTVQTVTVATVNAIANAATTAVTNKYNVGNGELVQESVSSTRTTIWNNSNTNGIHHTVNYTWNSDSNAGYFFTLGGKITASLSYPNSGQDSAWKALINSVNTQLGNASYQVSRTNNANTTYSQGDGTRSIDVYFTKNSGSSYSVDIKLSTTSPSFVTMQITASTSIYRSKLTSDTWGIAAPKPSSEGTAILNDGTGTVEHSKSLSVSPGSLSYSFYTGDAQSDSQTITITNNGTDRVNISSIGFTNFGVTPVVNGTALEPDETLPAKSLEVLESFTFTLLYAGIVGGTYSNSFTIFSDVDQGDIIVLAAVEVKSFILAPSSYSVDSDGSYSSSFQFHIDRSAPYTYYTCSISSAVGTARGFTVSQPANVNDGPTITFTPGNLTADSYTTTLYVMVNGKQQTATMTVNLSVSASSNLATWISARAPANAVVGISLDRIKSIKYLTLGVGLGADGSTILYADAQRTIDLSTLGVDADPHPELGIPLYNGGYDPSRNPKWVPFIKGPNFADPGLGYGVVIRGDGDNPTIPVTTGNDILVRRYIVNLNSDMYTWRFCVDDTGWVEIIDSVTGEVVIDTGPGGYSYETTNIDTPVSLTAGAYIIVLHFQNTGYPGSVAFQLNNSSGATVWSTLTPVRRAYANWMEVYRIPLTNGNATYLSRDYLVKDCGGAGSWGTFPGVGGRSFGSYFPDNSMFTVTDDGTGNIGVTFNIQANLNPYSDDANTTMSSFSYLPYYYSEGQNRYSQNPLEPNPINGTQTLYFVGFNKDYTINTTTLDFPTGNIYTPAAPPVDPGDGNGSGI